MCISQSDHGEQARTSGSNLHICAAQLCVCVCVYMSVYLREAFSQINRSITTFLVLPFLSHTHTP